jgi:hypothetical protein
MTDTREAFEAWFIGRDHHPKYGTVENCFHAWQAATAAERERAAKVCEYEATRWEGDGVPEPMSRLCAAAIRKGPTP